MTSSHHHERLREERKRLGLSQDEFASQLSLSRQTIGLYESGRTQPDVETLNRAWLTGVDIVYVITGKRSAELGSQNFNWDQLSQIAKAIDEKALKLKIAIPVEKRVVLMKLLYERHAMANALDDSIIEQFIQLAA